MRVASNATLRKMSDLVFGELVVFGDEVQQIGIVVATGLQNAEPLLGVLKSSDEPHPRLFRPWGDTNCVSFGCGWVIEPLVDEGVFPDNMNSRRAGWLSLSPAGWQMSFASSGIDQFGRVSLEWWNINNQSDSINAPGRGSVGFAKWRIWASDEVRLAPRGAPIFEYEAVPPKPR